MKKAFAIAASLIHVVVSANSQSEKKEPPPPPPKSNNETVKYPPPKVIIDEKVKAKKIDEEIVREPPVITIRGDMADKFYKRNPSVVGVSRQGDVVTVKKKDGTEEKYDMSKREDDKSFTDKYGVSPIPPLPPPPKLKSKA
ncbi:MAG TPA: hypothetical protein VFH08_06365 [Chitinophagaceae bacterium]|nr:hypothetical protein [Chitinophagaceae bacterium]